MTVTLIATTQVIPGEEEALNAYVEGVGPLVEKAGGTLVSRYQVIDDHAENAGPVYVSLIDYPDAAAIESVFSCKDYKVLETARNKAFSRYEVTVAEKL